MNINRVVLSGNLTRDAEMRSTRNGSSVLNFRIASNDRKLNKQTNQWEDVPNYVDCSIFGKRAENVEPFLRRGIKVCVEGKLRWSKFDTRDGGTREKLEVIVDELELMTAKSAEPRERAQESVQMAQETAQSWLASDDLSNNDVIPF